MSGIVEHALRALRVLEEITRPPRRPFADTDEPLDYTQSLCPASATPGSSIRPRKVCNMCDTEITGTDYNYCVDHRVSSEPDQEVCEHPYGQCRVHHPAWTDWMCTKPFGHDDQHGYAGCFWTESPLSDDELVAVRGLIQERYEPESVAAYMARAERVEGGYIIHDSGTPRGEWQFTRSELDVLDLQPGDLLGGHIVGEPKLDDDDRLAGLAAATYSSATADGPAGVEHPPVPPAGIPATADTVANMLAVEFWGKQIEDADQIGRIAADALLKDFDITHK